MENSDESGNESSNLSSLPDICKYALNNPVLVCMHVASFPGAF